MYHHHIISRDNKETIKKIYRKQKEDQLKGDWYETLMTDFDFIREENNDERISKIPKEQYRNMIKRKVENEALHYFLTLKEKSKNENGAFKIYRIGHSTISHKWSVYPESDKIAVLIKIKVLSCKT